MPPPSLRPVRLLIKTNYSPQTPQHGQSFLGLFLLTGQGPCWQYDCVKKHIHWCLLCVGCWGHGNKAAFQTSSTLTSQTANNFTEQTEATHPQLELTEPAATTCSAFLHPHSATYHLPFYSYLDPWSQHLQALSNCEETNFFFPLKPTGSFQLWFCSISCGDTADRAFLLAVLPFHRSHDT